MFVCLKEKLYTHYVVVYVKSVLYYHNLTMYLTLYIHIFYFRVMFVQYNIFIIYVSVLCLLYT